MAATVQMLRWGAQLEKITIRVPGTSGQLWHGGDQQPPVPPFPESRHRRFQISAVPLRCPKPGPPG